jgi:hypothetical protein
MMDGSVSEGSVTSVDSVSGFDSVGSEGQIISQEARLKSMEPARITLTNFFFIKSLPKWILYNIGIISSQKVKTYK